MALTLRLLALLTGLFLVVGRPVSAAVSVYAEIRASESASVPDILLGSDPRLSEETVRKNVALAYDLAPDDAVAARGGANAVYRSVDAAGRVNYLDTTNNLARRAPVQLSSKGIQIEKLMGGLSHSSARAVEQALIEVHEMGKNGGTLLNQINSIATSNPAYASQLERGYELLRSIGY